MKKSVLLRHLAIGGVALILCYLFWLSRPEWDPEMRLWRAVGDASFMLLFVTLVVGPLARLWSGLGKLILYRRETGIWFALLALFHTYLALLGWVRWDVRRFFGYEFIPELNRYARVEPGFGLANLVGMVAVFWAFVLMATSSDRATRALGPTAWKWLQYGSYTIFYLVTLHTIYFLFMHYTASFHRSVPPDQNWFRYPFLALALTIPLLQIAAFLKVVARNKIAAPKRGATAQQRDPDGPALPEATGSGPAPRPSKGRGARRNTRS